MKIHIKTICRSKIDNLGLEFHGDDQPLTNKRECTVSFVSVDHKGYRAIDIPVPQEQFEKFEIGQAYLVTVEAL